MCSIYLNIFVVCDCQKKSGKLKSSWFCDLALGTFGTVDKQNTFYLPRSATVGGFSGSFKVAAGKISGSLLPLEL